MGEDYEDFKKLRRAFFKRLFQTKAGEKVQRWMYIVMVLSFLLCVGIFIVLWEAGLP